MGEYRGLGSRAAVRNIINEIGPALIGADATDQRGIDRLLRELDGTSNMARLGGNATLPVSIAVAVAVAAAKQQPLWQSQCEGDGLIPLPMINILSGGAHAAGVIDIQDFLVIPMSATTFADAMRQAWLIRETARNVAIADGHPGHLVADEGGLGLGFPTNRGALDFLERVVSVAGLELGQDIAFAIDVAATQFGNADGNYRLSSEGAELTSVELVDLLSEWVDAYPIVSIEDILHEDDWAGWRYATETLGDRVQLLGDDLLVTNPDRLRRAVAENVCNAVLVKPNQIGTLSDAKQVVADAKAASYRTVLSARSGETEDSWLADLAVGWSTGQIKVGSTHRSERTAKWNRLLAIEATDLPKTTHYAGAGALGRSRKEGPR